MSPGALPARVRSAARTRRRLVPAVLLALATPWAVPTPGAAQEPDTLRAAPEAAVPDTLGPEADDGVSPGGAFLRSLVIPGWGHAAVESYTRGGFYFAAESMSGGMVLKSLLRREAAEELVALRRQAVESRLRAQGREDPDSIAALVDADEDVQAAEGLVESRSQQVEDWTALTVFLLFLGAADAYVSAHLQDFPEPLEVEVGGDGRVVELKVSVFVGGGG